MASRKIQIRKGAAEPGKKIVARHRGPPAPPPPSPPPPRRKKTGAGALFLKLSVVAVILAGCAFFFFKVHREATLRPRLEAIQRQRRLDAIDERISAIEECLLSVTEAESATAALIEQARKDVLLVTGETLDEPQPRVLPVEGAVTEAHPDKPQKPGDETSPPQIERPPAGSKGAPVDREVPPGMLTREELEARRRADATRHETKKADDAAQAAAPAETEGDAPSPPESHSVPPPETATPPDEPPAKPVPDTAVEELSIGEAGLRLLAVGNMLTARATGVREAAELARKKQAEAKSAPQVRRIEELHKEIESISGDANRLGKEAALDLDLARRAATHITALREQFEELKREAERIAEERRRAEEHRQRIALEKTWAAEDEGAAGEFFKDYNYAEAVERLKDGEDRYRTDPGRDAHGKVLDRYLYLRDLKTFLIERINAEPYAWGWGSPPAARDILGADELTIKLRGAEAVWTDIDTEQMVKLVEHYVGDRKIPRRRRARMLMAAAIYFNQNGKQPLAEKYAEKAVEADAPLKEDADRFFK